MPFTTRGAALMDDYSFRAATRPTHFYLALCKASAPPTGATKTLADLAEIAAGHGYTSGGYQLNPNSTDFPAITENDTRLLTDCDIKTVTWTASGGDIPASGAGALYVVLTTDEVTVSTRQVIWYATFRSVRTILSGQTLTLSGETMRIRGGSVIKSIQRGSVTISAVSTATATISAVDPTKSSISLLGVLFSNSGAQDPYQYNVTLTLTDATTVTATRGANTITLTVQYEVVEYW